MSIIRPFGAEDLLKINAVNIDPWTETVRPLFAMTCSQPWLHPPSSFRSSIRPRSTCSTCLHGQTTRVSQLVRMAEELTHMVSRTFSFHSFKSHKY